MSAEVDTLVEARALHRVFVRGNEEVRALDGVSLSIGAGELVACVGPSGSGKTTLVNLLGCLDNPTSGELAVEGRPIFGGGKPLGERALTRLRRELFGYIFQDFHLVPTLTALENVMLPLAFYRKEGNGTCEPERLLRLLGMEKRMSHLPGELSGGEMQRVAIARALVNHPRVLFADEPTGSLDSKRTAEIGDVLVELNRNAGLTIVMVTHDPSLARLATRVVELRDGRVHAG